MFPRKKQRNLRRRNDSEESDENKDVQIPGLGDLPMVETQGPGSGASSPGSAHGVVLLQSKKDKWKKADKTTTPGKKAPSLLSFDEEEGCETEMFRVKKSSHSKRVANKLKKEWKEEQMKKEKEEKEKKVNTQMSLGEYTSEKLQSLRDAQNTPVSLDNGQEKGEKEGEDGEKGEKFRPSIRAGVIPDAATIHAARKRRQMLRETGGEDFVPLDDTQRVQGEKSRLVREDENDRSDSEEERIDFRGVNPARSRREDIMEVLEGSDSEEGERDQDEEVKRWEQEQIRKGVSIPQVQTTQPQQDYNYYQQQYMYQQPSVYMGTPQPVVQPYSGGYNLPSMPPTSGPMVPPSQLPTVTLESVKDRLRDRLDSLKQVHSAHQREHDKHTYDMDSSVNVVDDIEGSADDVERQFTFFQEMRGYVRDLVECLNEKVPKIDQLETAMHTLLRQRAERFVQRRQDDTKDESEEQMNKTNKAAGSLDTMGRDSPGFAEVKKRRIAEREARRSRRRRARQAVDPPVPHHEGMSSDEEEQETDILRFNSEKDRIVAERGKVFEDVVDDFCTFRAIKTKFERWKYDFGEPYNEAYISLCLPKLFTPFVRLELLTWNPLEANAQDLEDMAWYDSLLFYGFRETTQLTKDDPDVKLLPSIVEKVVLQKLTGLAEHVWDPMSTRQTQRLVTLVQRLVDDYPTVAGDNKATQALLRTVLSRMRKTLDDDIFMPLYPKGVLENKASGAYYFLQRQFWTCVKLLGNMLQWHSILAREPLMELCVDGLLNRYMLLALQNSEVNEDSIEKSQKIISSFPRQWFADIEGDETLPPLQNLARYLSHSANTLHKNSIGCPDIDRRKARENIKQVAKLLVQIHALDHALQVAREHSLKDLKQMVVGR
ncbi:PAX3- and PAX7-binding protein 1-like isoform X3 [Branchiostoma floridae]|uniref:PAX3- and PAX7-binding protein 1-like isoform X3 n=1 Tax=Branchiostoma floridae TaxID=7739 RepID=A0A9J7N293_BRAFL|nr:PAX3- and PAX7-binding protein 1-like isoform X3 [Branchiostoma floridae]